MELRNSLLRTAFNALYFSGSHVLLRPLIGGVGAILTLHHVRPPRRDRFQPNQLLEVSPRYFTRLIRHLRHSGVDLVSLDEMHRRMTEGDFSRRFVCITFDDGYRDNREFAYPVLKRHEVPFAIFVAADFADRTGELWWLVIEAVVAQNDRVAMRMDDRDVVLTCATPAQKRDVFELIYSWLRGRNSEAELREAVRELAARHRIDIAAICRELCMDWSELAELAADPLVTIGAHSVTHSMLGMVSQEQVRTEIENSRAAIEKALGKRPQHFAYPVGDRIAARPREFKIAAELGFKTAVTTRPGALFRGHADHMTALPRISLNGEFQRQRYARVLVSGTATALWNRLRPLNVS
jgi:peptidoglycan/xylan/chitin deacetylase (PgdA/CDA1 family)